MAIKHMTYLDLSRPRREASASSALSDLQRMLNVPGISEEQRAQIQDRVQVVMRWMDGTLPTSEVHPKGVHHSVLVVEEVDVSELAE